MREPNILDYLPLFLQEIKEMQAHAVAENPELKKLWDSIEDVWNDQYLHTMTENGCERWEKMLKIIPLSTDTLQDRRNRIITRLNTNNVYTYPSLIEKMTSMLGQDGYFMDLNVMEFVLWVRIALTQKSQYYEILRFLKEIIPQNLILDYDLFWNRHMDLAPYTYAQLAKGTHRELREEPLGELTL